MSYSTLVPIPGRNSMNSGYSPARPSTLVKIFGDFPDLTDKCAPCKNAKVKALLETRDVGPFKVTGIRPALQSLESIFTEVKAAHPDLFNLLGTAGMLCYRRVRGSDSIPSNHATGSALDVTIGGILSPFNADEIPSGLIVLYGYMHAHGWYWGAGYNGRRDPMHFEAADETLRLWDKQGRI